MKIKLNKKQIIAVSIGFLTIIAIAVGVNAQKPGEFEGAMVVPYTGFVKMVDEDTIKEVKINFSKDKFNFYDTSDVAYETDSPRYEEFKKYLLEKDVNVTVMKDSNTGTIVMNLLFTFLQFGSIMFILYIVMSKMGGGIGGKKSSIVEKAPDIRFKDIAGIDESKEDIQFIVDFLKDPKKYDAIGAELPRGVVLYGPPGTGKTLTAKAVAGEAGVPFLSVSGSDFVEMYVGVGAKRVRELFKEARKVAPCIIFIDEMDAVGGKRNSSASHSENNQTVNALLAEMDGFDTKEAVIVMAATNMIDDLDPALMRPGRFDKFISISLPDNTGRLEILKIHSKGKKISDDVNLEEIAKMTIGFSGAALKTLINESAIVAVNKGSDVVRTEDIDDAFYKAVMKGHKKNRNGKEDKTDIKLIAFHEAGHALAAKLLTTNSIPRVTIIPSTTGAGGVTFNIPKKMGLLTKREVLSNIKVLYAGRAAERILVGSEDDVTTGASSDIQQATTYIKQYFNDFGMSDEFGMLSMDVMDEKSIYTEMAIKLSKQLYEETLVLLTDNQYFLNKIAEGLLEKETLNEEDLDRIIGEKIVKIAG